jgi:WD repeat-containing protein 70
VSVSFLVCISLPSLVTFAHISFETKQKTEENPRAEVEVGPLSETVAESPRLEAESEHTEEPEYDPSDGEDDLDPQELFPTTHELILKDHTKVVSALALDPSGARIISGSHDYDCKLWDFGGMDWRCKPFKSWEPVGTYYVISSPLLLFRGY